MNLWADFLTNERRVIHKWTHYFPIYEDHFGRYVNRPMVLLEIGCGQGGSLQMWKRHLGSFAQIVGTRSGLVRTPLSANVAVRRLHG